MKKIKYFKRYANINAEVKSLKKVLTSGWLTTGQVVKEFEKQFAEKAGYKYAIAVNSATSGLLLALQTSGIPKGSTIITTPYTFVATAHAIEQSGYDLRFVDIGLNTYCLECNYMYSQQISNIKGLVDVELAGLNSIGPHNPDFKVIRDCAHSIPKQNNFFDGDVVRVYSFYANKNISCGEGGIICTNYENQVIEIRKLINHGIDRDSYSRFTGNTSKKWQYNIVESGFKMNMSDVLAAICLEQLKLIDKIIYKRKQVVNWYNQYLDLNKIKTQSNDDFNGKRNHDYHLFLIRVPEDKRDYIIDELARHGIETSVHYKPLHMMTYFKNKYGFKDEDFPNAYHNYLQTISLPIYPDLRKSEVKYICKVLNSLI